MVTADYTDEEKLNEITRELAMRKKVYPGLIARGSLTMANASRQIDIMRAIANDYRPDRLPLGDPP